MKRCPRCAEVKSASAFRSYAYTTNQGKASVRLDSHCIECRRAHRNRSRSAAYLREWRAAHPEQVKAHGVRARSTDHARAVRSKLQAVRKARQRANAPYTRCDVVDAIYAIARGYRDSGVDVHVDHVMPLSRGGRHEWQNLSLLPARENMRKGSKPTCAMTGSQDAAGI